MGCSGSKLEEQEAVSLCRNRTDLISAAIRHRYAVADAHSAYCHSLLSVAASLHKFLTLANNNSQEISLPTQRKGESFSLSTDNNINNVINVSSAETAVHSHSNSEVGSGHIEFHTSDSEEEDSKARSHFHSETPNTNDPYNNFQPYHNNFQPYDQPQNFGSSFMNFHYARNQPPPSSTVHYVDPSSSSSVNYSNGYSYSYPYNYPNDNHYGFLGNSLSSPPVNLAPPANGYGGGSGESSSGNQKPPPPPPSPPRVSNWDFLNPFELQDSYYPNYTPSRSSRDVRDEEGIPDLEDEDLEHEVVKEVYGDQKFVGSSSKGYNSDNEGGSNGAGAGENLNLNMNSRSVEAVESEEDVVEKNVVADEAPRQQVDKNVASTSKHRTYQNVSEIGSEIRVQFEKAAAAAAEISNLLEVGKQPYRFRKSSIIEVSSRMMCAMPPSASDGEEFLNLEEDIEARSTNLSSTLQKLYIWEKKLQDEVRAEEKMRLLLDRNRKRLRYLAERGAEHNKIDEVQKLIKKLLTKIRIAIQVVDSISNTINKLRDEELWPQINELIHGLLKMWKAMLECHQIQSQAISEAKNLDSIASGGKLNDDCLNAMVDLELELLKWTGNFSSWINAQKNYVKSLNAWLILCLHYEPEITADGVAPYSPGRIGAPPIFVICNTWAQAMDMISEIDVISAMQGFAANLRQIWEKHGIDPNHKVMPSGELDRLVRAREREAQIIHKEVDALNKKLELVSGHNEYSGYTTEVSSLHLGLKQLFVAVENFTVNSYKAYEEITLRAEEERVASETAKLSG